MSLLLERKFTGALIYNIDGRGAVLVGEGVPQNLDDLFLFSALGSMKHHLRTPHLLASKVLSSCSTKMLNMKLLLTYTCF
jgi:hypothetical protein